MISINYILNNAGWATVEISNGTEEIKLCASYLHDSLKNLAETAIGLKTKNEEAVIFMDEPGEYWLILKKKENNLLEYELRWYKDWASWNLIHEEKYEVILRGETTVPKYINEVRKNLMQILEEFGTEGYKQRWGEHEFPLNEYEKLK